MKPVREPRILLATDAYLPWSGGSRVYYHNLYSRLSARYGYDVSVLTSHTAGDASFDLSSTTPHLRWLRHGNSLPDWKYRRLPACAVQLARLSWNLAQLAPDALHCGDLIPQALNAWIIHQITGRPYLVFVHGDEISQTDKRRHQPKLRNAIYRGAAALVAANPYALSHLERILGSRDRCHLLTPGVDHRHFYPGMASRTLRAAWGAEDRLVVLTAARLVKKKGHITLLRSLRLIAKEYPSLLYVIAGQGPERASLEQTVADLQLQQQVLFVGDVAHAQLGDYYRSADIFAMANCEDASGDIESFGMVFLEANACGKPVIGGLAGGAGAAVVQGRTGLLCPSGDEQSFADALLLLLRNPSLRQRMGDAGAARAQAEYRWETRADELHAITQSLLWDAHKGRSGTARAVGRGA